MKTPLIIKVMFSDFLFSQKSLKMAKIIIYYILSMKLSFTCRISETKAKYSLTTLLLINLSKTAKICRKSS